MNTITLDDHNFSVWSLVQRVKDKSMTLSHRKTMNIISNAIEDVTLVDKARTRVYSSFQRMSRFLPQAIRYEKMARVAETIYVFAIPDIVPPEIEGINYVYLEPTDALAREWFIVSCGPTYASALVTQEVTSIDDPDHMRVFNGTWTFDTNMITVLDQWLHNAVGGREFGFDNEVATNSLIQSNLLGRTIRRLDRLKEDPACPQHICREVDVLRRAVQTESIAVFRG